jgi:SPP1 family predicted phage head-tail adaptor
VITGRFDQPITIQSRTFEEDERFGTRVGTWVDSFDVLAEVQDVLPSRADRVSDEISMTRRPARIRMHWRDDVTQANRIKIGERIMNIIAGPAELGRRQVLELMVEELSTIGEEP